MISWIVVLLLLCTNVLWAMPNGLSIACLEEEVDCYTEDSNGTVITGNAQMRLARSKVITLEKLTINEGVFNDLTIADDSNFTINNLVLQDSSRVTVNQGKKQDDSNKLMNNALTINNIGPNTAELFVQTIGSLNLRAEAEALPKLNYYSVESSTDNADLMLGINDFTAENIVLNVYNNLIIKYTLNLTNIALTSSNDSIYITSSVSDEDDENEIPISVIFNTVTLNSQLEIKNSEVELYGKITLNNDLDATKILINTNQITDFSKLQGDLYIFVDLNLSDISNLSDIYNYSNLTLQAVELGGIFNANNITFAAENKVKAIQSEDTFSSNGRVVLLQDAQLTAESIAKQSLVLNTNSKAIINGSELSDIYLLNLYADSSIIFKNNKGNKELDTILTAVNNYGGSIHIEHDLGIKNYYYGESDDIIVDGNLLIYYSAKMFSNAVTLNNRAELIFMSNTNVNIDTIQVVDQATLRNYSEDNIGNILDIKNLKVANDSAKINITNINANISSVSSNAELSLGLQNNNIAINNTDATSMNITAKGTSSILLDNAINHNVITVNQLALNKQYDENLIFNLAIVSAPITIENLSINVSGVGSELHIYSGVIQENDNLFVNKLIINDITTRNLSSKSIDDISIFVHMNNLNLISHEVTEFEVLKSASLELQDIKIDKLSSLLFDYSSLWSEDTYIVKVQKIHDLEDWSSPYNKDYARSLFNYLSTTIDDSSVYSSIKNYIYYQSNEANIVNTLSTITPVPGILLLDMQVLKENKEILDSQDYIVLSNRVGGTGLWVSATYNTLSIDDNVNEVPKFSTAVYSMKLGGSYLHNSFIMDYYYQYSMSNIDINSLNLTGDYSSNTLGVNVKYKKQQWSMSTHLALSTYEYNLTRLNNMFNYYTHANPKGYSINLNSKFSNIIKISDIRLVPYVSIIGSYAKLGSYSEGSDSNYALKYNIDSIYSTNYSINLGADLELGFNVQLIGLVLPAIGGSIGYSGYNYSNQGFKTNDNKITNQELQFSHIRELRYYAYTGFHYFSSTKVDLTALVSADYSQTFFSLGGKVKVRYLL